MTVARARELLARFAVPGDPNSPEFLRILNEALERLHSMDDWTGRTGAWSINVTNGIITLPAFLESALKVQVDKLRTRIVDQSHQFLWHGPGDSVDWGPGMMEDIGEVASETEFPSTAGTLSVVSTSTADTEGVLRFHGVDSSGNRIIDDKGISGEALTLNGVTPVLTTKSFASLQGFQKPRTQGRITVTRGTTDIAVLEPWDLDPIYRRYNLHDTTAKVAKVYARRRFRFLSNEEDYVIPGNLGALKMAIFAITNEDEGNIDTSLKWWARALAILNRASDAELGGAEKIAEIKFDPYNIESITSLT